MKTAGRHKVARFLQKTGVDTRFVSLVNDQIFINNLRFSSFSRVKERLFLEKYPQYKVSRSKIFQKICTRASRVLKDALSPKETIFLVQDGTCYSMALYAVLESYTRKYGVEIIFGQSMDDLEKMDVCSVALPLTLDDEVENIISMILDGEKLRLLSSENVKDGRKIIYPLINIPRQWVQSWMEHENFNCTVPECEGLPQEMLKFLEIFIPDVREKMYRSGVYTFK
ncbi:MAG: ATPase [Methanobacteriaceae archaeon]